MGNAALGPCAKILLCKTGDAVPTAHKTGRTLLDRDAMELARYPLHSRYKTLSSCAHCSADSFVRMSLVSVNINETIC